MSFPKSKATFLNLRLSLIVCCLLLAAGTVDALPCAQVKSQPDAWVAAKINALVTAARRAYEKEEAESAYEKVLDGITNTIRQCNLNDDDHSSPATGNFSTTS